MHIKNLLAPLFLALCSVSSLHACKHSNPQSTSKSGQPASDLPTTFEDPISFEPVNLQGVEYVVWLRHYGAWPPSPGEDVENIRVLDPNDLDESGQAKRWAGYSAASMLDYLTTSTNSEGILNYHRPDAVGSAFKEGDEMCVTQGSLADAIKLTYQFEHGAFDGLVPASWRAKLLIPSQSALFFAGAHRAPDGTVVGYAGPLDASLQRVGFGMLLNQAKTLIVGQFVSDHVLNGVVEERIKDVATLSFTMINGRREGPGHKTDLATGAEWDRVYKNDQLVAETAQPKTAMTSKDPRTDEDPTQDLVGAGRGPGDDPAQRAALNAHAEKGTTTNDQPSASDSSDTSAPGQADDGSHGDVRRGAR